MTSFAVRPQGRFSLAAAQRFLGGFTPAGGSFADAGERLTMAFPVDGWTSSAAAVVWQDGSNRHVEPRHVDFVRVCFEA